LKLFTIGYKEMIKKLEEEVKWVLKID
jgi:hypothetical protein